MLVALMPALVQFQQAVAVVMVTTVIVITTITIITPSSQAGGFMFCHSGSFYTPVSVP